MLLFIASGSSSCARCRGGAKALSFGKARARLISRSRTRSLQDVAGVDEAKEELRGSSIS